MVETTNRKIVSAMLHYFEIRDRIAALQRQAEDARLAVLDAAGGPGRFEGSDSVYEVMKFKKMKIDVGAYTRSAYLRISRYKKK